MPDTRKTPKVEARVGCCDDLDNAMALGMVKVSMITGKLFLRYRGKNVVISGCPWCRSVV